MNQLVQPNLNAVGYPLYCLAYVENVFGSASGEFDALQAWEDTQFKHFDTPPSNVSVPVFWNWTGQVNGVTRDYGHVAVWVNGQIYTNPLTGAGHRVFPSIQALQTAYGLGSYLGWSEDLTNKRIVEEAMTKAEAYTVTDGFYRWGTGSQPTPDQSEYWAQRISTIPTGLDELYQAMLKQSAVGQQYALYPGQLYTKK